MTNVTNPSYRVSIHPDCITAYNDFRLGKGSKAKYIIFKIADNRQEIVIDEVSDEPDYEVFRTKLEEARDSKGNPSPRYAVYDVHFELEGGEGQRFVSLVIFNLFFVDCVAVSDVVIV